MCVSRVTVSLMTTTSTTYTESSQEIQDITEKALLTNHIKTLSLDNFFQVRNLERYLTCAECKRKITCVL